MTQANQISFPRLPANLRESDKDYYASVLHRDNLPRRIAVLRNARATGMGLLYTGIRLRPESFPDVHESPEWQWEKKFYAKPVRYVRSLLGAHVVNRRRVESHAAIWCTDTWTHNYYDWVAENIARLAICSDLWKAGMPLALPARLLKIPYIREVIERLGIREMIPIETNETILFRELHVVERTAAYNYANVPATHQARDLMAIDKLKAEPRRCIHISRERANRRLFTDVEGVRRVFDDHGFETVCMEELDFRAQMQLMSETRVLAGIHGAGFANMMFMPSHGRILEGVLENTFSPCYFTLANACSHDYWYVPCKPLSPDLPYTHTDYRMNLKLLDETLDQLLSQ